MTGEYPILCRVAALIEESSYDSWPEIRQLLDEHADEATHDMYCAMHLVYGWGVAPHISEMAINQPLA